MTVFDYLKECNEEMMVEFLYRFSKDIIDNFGNYIVPSKESILNLLNKEL